MKLCKSALKWLALIFFHNKSYIVYVVSALMTDSLLFTGSIVDHHVISLCTSNQQNRAKTWSHVTIQCTPASPWWHGLAWIAPIRWKNYNAPFNSASSLGCHSSGKDSTSACVHLDDLDIPSHRLSLYPSLPFLSSLAAPPCCVSLSVELSHISEQDYRLFVHQNRGDALQIEWNNK